MTQPKQTSPLSISLLLLLSVKCGDSLRDVLTDMFWGSAAGRGVKREMLGGAVVLCAATTHSSFRIFTLPHRVIQLALILSSHTHTHTHTHTAAGLGCIRHPWPKDYGRDSPSSCKKACALDKPRSKLADKTIWEFFVFCIWLYVGSWHDMQFFCPPNTRSVNCSMLITANKQTSNYVLISGIAKDIEYIFVTIDSFGMTRISWKYC